MASVTSFPLTTIATITATGSTEPRTLADRFADVYNVMDYGATGDGVTNDAPAINAAIVAAVNGGSPNGAIVFFPPAPSGYYNIDGVSGFLDVHKPTPGDPTWSITLMGSGSGGGSCIRVAPGSVTPPEYMLYVNVFATDDAKSTGRVHVTGLRFDGWGLCNHNVWVHYAVGMQMDNCVLRNVKAGTDNANLKVIAGYECIFDESNRLENVNDPDNVIYTTSADLPDYNLYTTGTDSHYSAVAIDAKIANYYQAKGGNNVFLGAHGWGYVGGGGSDGQPNLRPQYTYYMRGVATIIGSFSDSPTVAGFYLTKDLFDGGTDTQGAIVSGCFQYIFGGGSADFVQVAAGGMNNIITDNNTGGYDITFADAVPSDTNIVQNNSRTSITSPIILQGYKGTEQKLSLSNDSGNTYIAASAASGVGSDNSTLKISANGSGGIIQHLVNSVTVQNLTPTGVRSLVPHTFGVAGTTLGQALFSGSTSGTTTLQPAATASGTLTLPAATDTLVGRATTDTLTNKTLTAPIIATISNTGTLTLPTSTDTLVGRDTTDTLTNKTLTGPVIATISNSGTLTLPTSTDTLVGRATTDTFTNKTYDTAGTGNSFSINGVAVTANTGTGAVARAANPSFTGTVNVNSISGFGSIATSSYLKSGSKLVSALTAAATAGAGARDFVTDANATTFLSVVAGGGANTVPVVSNGTNWLIG